MNIVFKDEIKRLVTAPVLVPDRPDCDACRGEEPLTAAKIERMAFEYMETHRIVDQFHDYHVTKNNVAYPVASWILETPQVYKNIRGETVELPEGTWMATVKVADDQTWNMIERGELQGFSVTALSKEIADKLASHKERVLIKDLNDPVGYTISLVPEPCVHEAIFCSIKEDTPKPNPVVKAGRMISDRTMEKLKSAYEALTQLMEAADAERNIDIQTKSNPEVEKMDIEEFKTKLLELVDQFAGEAAPAEDKPGDKEEDAPVKDEGAQKEDETKEDEPEDKEDPAIKEDKEDPKDNEIAALKAEVDRLKKAKKQSLEGQDGTGTPQAAKSLYEVTGRDAYGRAIKK